MEKNQKRYRRLGIFTISPLFKILSAWFWYQKKELTLRYTLLPGKVKKISVLRLQVKMKSVREFKTNPVWHAVRVLFVLLQVERSTTPGKRTRNVPTTPYDSAKRKLFLKPCWLAFLEAETPGPDI